MRVTLSNCQDLHSQLSKSESDKQKIADEAFRRAQIIQQQCNAKLEDAMVSQAKQADLVERLQVCIFFVCCCHDNYVFVPF